MRVEFSFSTLTTFTMAISLAKSYLIFLSFSVLEEYNPDFKVEEKDFKLAREVIKVLDPLFVATKMICRRDATLLTAEIVFKKLISELEKQDSEFSVKMAESIRKRYKERRNKPLVSLLKYLTTGSSKDDEKDALFKLDSRPQMIKTAKKLMIRLYPKGDSTEPIAEKDNDKPDDLEVENETFESSLEKEILKGTQAAKPKDCDIDEVANEFAFFDKNRKKTESLELIHNALLTIKPTSVEAERNFSAAGFFLSNLRAGRLGHKMLDSLCISRAYFLKEKH